MAEHTSSQDTLKGAKLQRTDSNCAAKWGEAQCAFCSAKFLQEVGEAASGYSTADRERWICEHCFVDFSGHYGWEIEGSHPKASN